MFAHSEVLFDRQVGASEGAFQGVLDGYKPHVKTTGGVSSDVFCGTLNRLARLP